jgi:thiol-disulfide isomerase/thioredoxin
VRFLRLLAAFALCSGCSLKPAGPELVDTSPSERLTTAARALELSLPRYLGGEAWTLGAHRGHVVLLDVWATWCEPCRDALPLYQDIAKEFAPRGLEVFTINIDADPRPITPFLEEAKVSLPVLLDPEARQAESTLKVKLMPTAFLVDKKGLVRFVHEGFDEGQLATWLSEIETLLAEPGP